MALIIRQACEFLAAIICILALCSSCDGSLTAKPTNIEAVVGQRVQLNCSTSERFHVHWDHASVGSTSRNYVFFSGVMILPYSQRFQLDRDNATGRYNLVIPSVQKEDAGNYRCMDMAGHGEQAEAELIVLDSDPLFEPVSISFCERTSQEFETSSTVGFRGNLVPEMECSSSSGVQTSRTVVKGKIWDNVTHKIRLSAHWTPEDSHPIICSTTISHLSSFIKTTVTYAFGSTQTMAIDIRSAATVVCKANSSEHCRYQWIHKDTSNMISDQTLTTSDEGQYTCEATCMLETEICRVIPLVAVLETHEAKAIVVDRRNVTIPVVLATVVVVGVICLIVAVALLMFRKTRRRQNRERKMDANQPRISTPNGVPRTQTVTSDNEKTNNSACHNYSEAQEHSSKNGNSYKTGSSNCSQVPLLKDTRDHTIHDLIARA